MPNTLQPPTKITSHQITRERFGRESMAQKYSSEYGTGWRDRREKACILECLNAIPAGSKVLDLPCGTGRMTRVLVERGYRVTGADASEAMLSRARENYATYRGDHPQSPEVPFSLRDVLATGFATDEFDGVSCIRLFHHFSEAETRRKALRRVGANLPRANGGDVPQFIRVGSLFLLAEGPASRP